MNEKRELTLKDCRKYIKRNKLAIIGIKILTYVVFCILIATGTICVCDICREITSDVKFFAVEIMTAMLLSIIYMVFYVGIINDRIIKHRNTMKYYEKKIEEMSK